MRYAFADCLLDTDRYSFARNGEPVSLEPQVFDLLALLVENPGRLISRDELIERVWDGRIVSEATISARINAVRTAVGDTGRAQAIIRTVPRRGIELIVAVQSAGDAPGPKPANDHHTVRYTTAPDGAMIAWATSGEGPPLMYAASHVTHLELDWNSPLRRPIFDALGAKHRLIRYDIRGTGLSDDAKEGEDLATHLGDFIAVADAAGLDRFPILANLNSAQVAIRFAAEHPDRVSRMVLQTPYARGRALRGLTPTPPEADPFILLLTADGWGDPQNGHMRAWMSMAVPGLSGRDLTEMIRLMGSVTSSRNALASRHAIDLFDCRPWLARVRAPTLVIHGSHCAVHPLEEGRIVAAGIPGAEFHVVDSGNTVCMPPDPTFDEQIRAILDFIDADGGA